MKHANTTQRTPTREPRVRAPLVRESFLAPTLAGIPSRETPATEHADRELTALASASLSAAQVPTRVRLAPWGDVDSTSGAFVVDDESAQLVLEAFARHGTDLPIDYEHQTLGGPYASPNGQAPAAGWIKQIEVVPGDGLFAVVEWTVPALENLAAKQYRYLSPVALVRKSDRKMVALHSAALTNKPAIIGMAPIIHRACEPMANPSEPRPGVSPSEPRPSGSGCRNRRVAQREGEAPAEPARPAIGAVSWTDPTAVTSPHLVRAALCDRLEIDTDADVNALLLAASRRLRELDDERAQEIAEHRVAEAIRTGRATEAQRPFAIRLALTDGPLFDEWLATAPVVVTLGRLTAPPESTRVHRHTHVVSAARAEFRAHPELAALTSEGAYVADALRRAGVDAVG